MKVVAKPNSSNATAQPPLTAPNAPTNIEGKKPSWEGISENNPPPLNNIPVCTGTPWPKAGKTSGNLFELRKDWPIPPTNNTATVTISKPSIKIEPQAQEHQPPVQQHCQKQSNADGDQTAPFAKI